jgi:2-oxoglutarate dehydrogenase E2 component (dihydrolipoamide succinyltransferase)
MGAAVGGAHCGEDRRAGGLLMAATAPILMPLEQEGSKSVVRAWLKRVGETVKRDEPIVELETDKVAVEVPAPADGVLASIALHEGDEAAPGATLGVLTLAGAGVPTHGPLASSRASAGAGRRDAGAPYQRLSPLVKRLLAEHKLSAEGITGTGRDGRITNKYV